MLFKLMTTNNALSFENNFYPSSKRPSNYSAEHKLILKAYH